MKATTTLLGTMVVMLAATSVQAADAWRAPLFEATAVWQSDDTIEVAVDIFEANDDGMATRFVASAKLKIRDGRRGVLTVMGTETPLGFTVEAIKPTRGENVHVIVTVSQDQSILSVESQSVPAVGRFS
ncbi:MAG: hypothetical protein GC159_13185 [Phycisphaera sp.]|nr:hypothetical protein [Phycisphaera sp.]